MNDLQESCGRYKRRLPPCPEVLFLTNDADNRKKAAAAGLTAMTTAVSILCAPGLPGTVLAELGITSGSWPKH